jgi:hypothetical protein
MGIVSLYKKRPEELTYRSFLEKSLSCKTVSQAASDTTSSNETNAALELTRVSDISSKGTDFFSHIQHICEESSTVE